MILGISPAQGRALVQQVQQRLRQALIDLALV